MIYFDSETRSFGKIGNPFKKVGPLVNANPHATHFITVGSGAAIGTGVGMAAAKRMAKKKAKELGYEPGSPEYNALVRKYMASGAAIGAAGGALTAEGGIRATGVIKDRAQLVKAYKAANPVPKGLKARMAYNKRMNADLKAGKSPEGNGFGWGHSFRKGNKAANEAWKSAGNTIVDIFKKKK